MTPLERITERVSRSGDVNVGSTPRPLLTLEEFFDGNTVDGSIWCNCFPTPSSADAFSILKQIRSRPDVGDVRVEISMFDDPAWPFSEVVWVMTGAAADQVQSWFPEAVAPSETWAGWCSGVVHETVSVSLGMQPIGCWWD